MERTKLYHVVSALEALAHALAREDPRQMLDGRRRWVDWALDWWST